MDTKKIEKLIQLLKKHDLHEMEIEDEGQRIRLTKSAGYPGVAMAMPAAAPSPAISAHDAGSAAGAVDAGIAKNQVRSPFVGTFYEAASPGAEPFVRVGQRVKKGDTLCIIEAMKIMNEIEAEKDCTIKEILVANAQAVEYDQAIFTIE